MALFPKQIADNKSSGQIMVEALISIAVIILAVFGLVVLMTAAVKNSTYAKDRSAANFYALQEIEDARNTLISSWGTSISSATTGVGPNFLKTARVFCCTSGSPFTCTQSQTASCGRKKITVTVEWQSGSNTHDVIVSTLVSER